VRVVLRRASWSLSLPWGDMLPCGRWEADASLSPAMCGFFLRVRLGHRHAQLGGTGYRMARITGERRL